MRRRRLSYTIALAGALALVVTSGSTMAQAATGTDTRGLGQAHADAPGRGMSAAAMPAAAPAGYPVTGIDVSHWQGSVDWASVASAGTKFVYAKSTEGISYADPNFAANLSGAKAQGIFAGAYHFGHPELGDPVGQADFFLSHAGYARDGLTLPPMLDVETGATVGLDTCYGLSTSAMVSWIGSFVNEVAVKTGSPTTIYTASSFWNQCTGGSSAFSANPLFVAHWASTPTPLPTGWSTWTFWQYADSGSLPGDQDVFNGTLEQLTTLVIRSEHQFCPRSGITRLGGSSSVASSAYVGTSSPLTFCRSLSVVPAAPRRNAAPLPAAPRRALR